MWELREALSAILGVAVGLVFVAYPGIVLRVQTAGTRPDRQPGPDGETHLDGGVWYWMICALGVVFLLGGVYFAVRPFL